MGNAAIVCLYKDDIRKGPSSVQGRAFSWLFLGRGTEAKAAIEQAMGADTHCHIGGLLQEIAFEERSRFVDVVAELGACQKNHLYWWASAVSYKSPLGSDLFLHLCYAGVLERISSTREWTPEKPLVVFVENQWLYRYLWSLHRRDGRFGFPSSRSVLRGTLKGIAYGMAARSMNAAKVVVSRVRLGRAGRSRRHGENQVLFWADVRERSFAADGAFHEAFFERLKASTVSKGVSTSFVVSPLVATRLQKKLLAAEAQSTLLVRHVSLFDALRYLFTFFSVTIPRRIETELPGLAILLQYEVLHDWSTLFKQLLLFSAAKNWLKVVSSPTTVVYPFENQPWEKMLCGAWRASGKKVKLIGYQHSGVARLLLNYFPGKGEQLSQWLPQVLVTCGQYTLELFRRSFGDVELANGGALRYAHLHLPVPESKATDKAGRRVILVAFPYSLDLTLEMLFALFNAFGSNEEPGVAFLLKLHPDVPFSRVAARFAAWPAYFQVVDKPVGEILRQTDLVLYSSSTIGLESFVAGKTVVRYDSEHVLALDPMDALDDAGVEGCSFETVRRVLLDNLRRQDHSAPREKNVARIAYFFSPPDLALWDQVL